MTHLRPVFAIRGILLACATIAAWSLVPVLAGDATEDPVRARMEEWQRDARTALAHANDPAAADLLPEGVRPSSLNNRRRDLEQTLLAISRHEKALAIAPEYQRTLEAALNALEQWSGFEDERPFSILRHDDLKNQRDAVAEKRDSQLSSIAIIERSLETLVAEEQNAAETLRRRNTEADRGGDEAKWRVESARIAQRLIQARRTSLTTTLANTRTQLATSEAELALLDRQIRQVEVDVVFSDEDFEAISEASRQRHRQLTSEMNAHRQRLRAATTARDRAADGHAKALAAEPADATTTSPELALATARLEVAEATVDSLQVMAEAIEWLQQIESYHLSAQEDRWTMMNSPDRADRVAAQAAIRAITERLSAWESVTANELAAVAADLSRVEARTASLTEGDPRLPLLNEHRAILLERQSAIQRVSRAVVLQKRQLERWVVEHEARRRSAGERIAEGWYKLAYLANAFFAVEVFQYQKGDGEEGQRSVTLGKLFAALLTFLIPYLIAHMVVRRIQRTTVALHLIGDAQANTLRNWLMIVIGFVLALIALKFLDIPLTVFAFFGGALAIGIGFGTQTLIKNFMSGIIVLFERRIRVGDILDVDGIIGTVTEINTRSSVVRSADGLETMVPNSLFLENRVTNLTLTNRCNRRVIRLGVAYGTQPGRVIEILRECADRHGLVLKDPEPLVLFEDFGDSALMFAVYFWVEFNERTNPMMVASDLRIMIEKRLSEAGISIPFPQRDLHLASSTPVTVRFENQSSNPQSPS